MDGAAAAAENNALQQIEDNAPHPTLLPEPVAPKRSVTFAASLVSGVYETFAPDEYDRSNTDLDVAANAILAEIEQEEGELRLKDQRDEFDREMAELRAEELERERARAQRELEREADPGV